MAYFIWNANDSFIGFAKTDADKNYWMKHEPTAKTTTPSDADFNSFIRGEKTLHDGRNVTTTINLCTGTVLYVQVQA